MYKKSLRDNSLTQFVYRIYKRNLGDDLLGIIMCGGAGKADAQTYEGADIDYLVVVNEINPVTLVGLSRSQADLDRQFNAEPSHTIITGDELAHVRHDYLEMDGKAVQAIIEAQAQDIAGIEITAIPRLNSDEIKDFSRANLSVLRALLRKVVVRSELDPDDAQKIHMAKLALIVQKMYMQAVKGAGFSEAWEGRDQLKDIKVNPGNYDKNAIRRVMLSFVELSVQDVVEKSKNTSTRKIVR